MDKPALKYPPYTASKAKELVKEPDVFKAIRKQDFLVHHPFQSFNAVIDFISQAAEDPNVLAIKQTFYRTSADSTLMKSLIEAAKRGKEVTVIVELFARFDEEANINWAAKLEDAGAHVVYGVVGHKTHAKMAMVVRREDGVLRWQQVITTSVQPNSTQTLACSLVTIKYVRMLMTCLPSSQVWENPISSTTYGNRHLPCIAI